MQYALPTTIIMIEVSAWCAATNATVDLWWLVTVAAKVHVMVVPGGGGGEQCVMRVVAVDGGGHDGLPGRHTLPNVPVVGRC